MFVSLYFPAFDAREFYPERETRTLLPAWPTPDLSPNPFQRNLGAIAPRPLGGVRGWAAEASICEVRSIKLSSVQWETATRPSKAAFRRFYSDGNCGLQFSLGFSVPDVQSRTLPQQISALKAIFSLTMSTRHRPNLVVMLKDAGQLMAELFTAGTTKGNRSGKDSERVYHGRPLLIVEGQASDPRGAAQHQSPAVLCDKVSVSDLSRSLGRSLDCPILGLNSTEPSRHVTRSTRIILARLYLELFVFERCIALARSPKVAQMDEEGRERLLSRLALSGSRLAGRRALAITRGTDLYDQLQKAFATVHRPGQIDALLQTLAQLRARSNLVTSVMAAAKLTGILDFDMHAIPTGVINMTTYNNYGQAGAMGDHAQATHFSQTEMGKSANIDLALLANQLAELQAEMQKQATTSAEIREMGLVAQAKEAAEQGDSAGMLSHLSKASQWVLGMAEKISVGLVVAVIKDHLGRS